jgi:uncharacterized protein YceK
MRRFAVSVAICILIAGCGSSPSSSSTGHIKGGTYNRTNTCGSNQWVGNRRSHAVHRPGSRNLPSAKNQVCFSSLSAAQNAGYHLSH